MPIGIIEIKTITDVIIIKKNLNLILSFRFLKIKNINKKNNKFDGFKNGAKNLDK